MLPEIAREELAATLDATALDILADAGVARPPIDVFQVAESLEITVALDEHQQGRARLVRLADYRRRDSHPTILLRPEPRAERRQWALAHELGECFAWRVFSALGVDPRETPVGSREAVASQLAGRLLLPRAWLADDGPTLDWDLFALKAVYATASHELIARRMLDFSAPIIVTIFDHERVTMRRSNVRGRVPPSSELELECWEESRRTNRSCELCEGLRRVRAWPVHEPDWKREILRTDLEELE